MARSFIRPCRPRAQKSNAEREIVVVANELIRRAAGKPVAPGLRIKAQQMVAVFVCFSDPQFADDAAFGKKLLHLVACSLLPARARLCIRSAECAIQRRVRIYKLQLICACAGIRVAVRPNEQLGLRGLVGSFAAARINSRASRFQRICSLYQTRVERSFRSRALNRIGRCRPDNVGDVAVVRRGVRTHDLKTC
jgi:hypothetical protein